MTAYMKFRKSMLGWTKVADQAYFDKRALVNFYAPRRGGETPASR